MRHRGGVDHPLGVEVEGVSDGHRAEFDRSLFDCCLVALVENVIVKLPTSIDVVQKRLCEGFWRVKSIRVVVLHL